ncbi:MAG: signal peptidase I [Oscillospiraceae bacterium]|nr:signal peptidase I [Oscillospiraceae bacterium]
MEDEKRDLPTTEQLETELRRLRYQQSFARNLRSTIGSLIVTAAIAVIISTMLLPVLRVTGTSMTPTLQNDEILISNKISDPERGDIIAFYYNNKVLLKRLIGLPGDVIDIAEDGTVLLNGEVLDEPYVSELARGECDITLPYQVPDNRYFVLGDHRAVSIDSRSTSVGCVASENVIGIVFVVIGPLKNIRFL